MKRGPMSCSGRSEFAASLAASFVASLAASLGARGKCRERKRHCWKLSTRVQNVARCGLANDWPDTIGLLRPGGPSATYNIRASLWHWRISNDRHLAEVPDGRRQATRRSAEHTQWNQYGGRTQSEVLLGPSNSPQFNLTKSSLILANVGRINMWPCRRRQCKQRQANLAVHLVAS